MRKEQPGTNRSDSALAAAAAAPDLPGPAFTAPDVVMVASSIALEISSVAWSIILLNLFLKVWSLRGTVVVTARRPARHAARAARRPARRTRRAARGTVHPTTPEVQRFDFGSMPEMGRFESLQTEAGKKTGAKWYRGARGGL